MEPAASASATPQRAARNALVRKNRIGVPIESLFAADSRNWACCAKYARTPMNPAESSRSPHDLRIALGGEFPTENDYVLVSRPCCLQNSGLTGIPCQGHGRLPDLIRVAAHDQQRRRRDHRSLGTLERRRPGGGGRARAARVSAAARY